MAGPRSGGITHGLERAPHERPLGHIRPELELIPECSKLDPVREDPAEVTDDRLLALDRLTLVERRKLHRPRLNTARRRDVVLAAGAAHKRRPGGERPLPPLLREVRDPELEGN